MKTKMQSIKRAAYIAAAFTLAIAGVAQGLLSKKTFALEGAPLVNREIRMSNSAVGATGTTYLVVFTPSANYQIKGIIVDFCGGLGATAGAGTPIIGDSACNIPDGFDIGTPNVVTTNVESTLGTTLTGLTDLGDGTGSWTAADHFANNQSLRLTNAAGPNITTGNRYMFAITGITNPTDEESFYARILTYKSDTGDVVSYTHNTPGSTAGDGMDYGGIALSTNKVIQITAKVQETLTFCVSKADPGAGCAGVTDPILTLGHGANEILDPTATDTDTAFMQASTNAQSGINIRMKNSNTCGGLSRNGGTDSCPIAAVGQTTGSLTDTIPKGETPAPALFGLNVTSGGGMNAQAPYSTAGSYGMDDATAGNDVTGLFGSLISASGGPLDGAENTLTFAATATVTTPAGLYSANMTVIATGTF